MNIIPDTHIYSETYTVNILHKIYYFQRFCLKISHNVTIIYKKIMSKVPSFKGSKLFPRIINSEQVGEESNVPNNVGLFY